MTTSVLLTVLLATFALSIGSIAWAVMSSRERQSVVRRALGVQEPTLSAIRPLTRTPMHRVADWLAARVPATLGGDTVSVSRLEQAGYTSANAASLFGLVRVASVVLGSGLALVFAPSNDVLLYLVAIIVGVAVGVLAPMTLLNGRVAARQTEIRRGLADALDLLVVCVEAGIALDASMQRVSRELVALHPLLADELLGMGRRMAAGMPRDQALHALYVRTGVEELRTLASHMLQSEKWGTSIVSVLRLYSEQLRHKRRVTAEKRAATASTRMMIPLALFIFPTLFVVLLGPAIMRLSTQF